MFCWCCVGASDSGGGDGGLHSRVGVISLVGWGHQSFCLHADGYPFCQPASQSGIQQVAIGVLNPGLIMTHACVTCQKVRRSSKRAALNLPTLLLASDGTSPARGHLDRNARISRDASSALGSDDGCQAQMTTVR